ncbi:MAG: nucleotide exchange factor GrpE [Armatimonadota bacterium]|nr:nucleotide exchange factor GrpE [Armatimonadota bacterium]
MEQVTTQETPVAPEQEVSPEGATSEMSIEQLQARVAELEQAYEEQRNLYLRALADFQNYRRRQQEEMERQRALLLESLMEELLPILDNFERALQAAEATRDLEPLLEGVRLTERQIKALLSRYDIHPIEAVGQPFDPNLHEAIQRVETDDYEDGIVIDEVERGYRMGERVLRPSRVIVARRPPQPPTEGIDVTV